MASRTNLMGGAVNGCLAVVVASWLAHWQRCWVKGPSRGQWVGQEQCDIAHPSIRKVALHERVITLRALDVQADEVRHFGEAIAAHVFAPQRWSSFPGTTVQFVPGLMAEQQSETFVDYKSRYVLGVSKQPVAGLAEQVAECVRRRALHCSFLERVTDAGVKPANDQSLRDNYRATVTELQTFIAAVGACCAALHSAGADPVVLVGH